MERPTQMLAFDAMYGLASRDGRGQALFGKSYALARDVYERSLIGSGYPSAYLEFPLLGEPCFDILTVHASVGANDRFAPGAGFGYQRMFDWFVGVHQRGDISCGIELDTSVGETDRAGVYLQFRREVGLVDPFLESVGERGRAASYHAVLDRMPDGWPPAYVGLFPGRVGAPLRIGGYLSHRVQSAIAADPALLARHFDAIGFAAYDEPMLARCAEFLALVPSADFQFDIMPDGSLGDVFGLSLSFNEARPRAAHDCMESGYGAAICRALESWGLADDRWRLIADAAFARHVPFVREDGASARFALCCLFNYAKVKFAATVPQPAKFYLRLTAGEVDGA